MYVGGVGPNVYPAHPVKTPSSMKKSNLPVGRSLTGWEAQALQAVAVAVVVVVRCRLTEAVPAD
jgi:hypothetical protein